MSLDHRTATAQRARQLEAQQQQPHPQAPGSHSEQQAQPPSSGAHSQGMLAHGLDSRDLVTGGRPPGNELKSMDPAELAELAKFWRPRLDSAERRYLRCRTMQLGEALLQVGLLTRAAVLHRRQTALCWPAPASCGWTQGWGECKAV